ncbi:MAG: peptidase MA family metallohydrolase [Candidatus Omnitrophota bacterium]
MSNQRPTCGEPSRTKGVPNKVEGRLATSDKQKLKLFASPQSLTALLILLIFTTPLSADTLVLKNGSKVFGIISQESEKEVTLQFDKSSTVTLSKEDVASVSYGSEEEHKALRAEWEKLSPVPPEPERPFEGAQEVLSGATSKILTPSVLASSLYRVPNSPPLTPTKENQLLFSEIKGKWKVRKSEHFVVYYQELEQGRAISDKAEYHLEKILDDLRIPKRQYWRKKFTVYVLKDPSEWKSFLQKLGVVTELTGGFTVGAKTREIFLCSDSIPYLKLAFPHELAHILLEDLAAGRKIPLWFNEGFANYEGGIIGISEELMLEAASKGFHIVPSKLVQYNLYPADIKDRIIFYTEAEKLVEYLITQHGRNKFAEFTKQLLETGDAEKAFQAAYGGKIGTFQNLDILFLKYLLE